MTHIPEDDHDHGLLHDLEEISRRMVERRRALSWLGMAAAAPMVAGALPVLAQTRRGPIVAGSRGSSSSSSSSTTSSTTSSGTCVADPTETNGPYPADGTNTSRGSTSNVLTSSGIVRTDIRSSFISSTTQAQGVQVALTLTLVNANNGCAPLAGYAIYIWHCDASGYYSLYTVPTESYLRGVQVTDANGQVTFKTIFPACYSGRWPHIHVEIFKSLSAATSGRASALITQMAMPSAVCSAVFNGSSLYRASISNFAQSSIARDNVFGDNTSAQIAQMTPAMAGSVSGGYVATNTIGLAV
jgi:protocatechuate 3,4-dioxygenase beta subunit